MRSLLFVPGDDARKLEKGLASGADALLIDLEDSVATSRKEAAREIVSGFLAATPRDTAPKLFVRVNAFETGLLEADLDGVMSGRPDGIMLPKSRSGQDCTLLGARLAVREAELGLPDGVTTIIPIATEVAAAIFQLGTYAGSTRRLAGLTWGAEDLAADLGAERNRLTDGTYADPFRLARSLALLAAHAAGVEAIDTIYADFRDHAGLEAETIAARQDGFGGKMAIHPAQVPVINRVFTPDAEAVAMAERIVAHFRDNPEAGVTAINGRMIDRPHLRQAERVLARAAAARMMPG
jgi:citrate lyase subunit beta / citryl-CoA lyase